MRINSAICSLALVLACAASRSAAAEDIVADAGIKGGLVVHLGCGQGERTAALHANDSYLVQGLDADAENVATARKHIKQLGLYGKVSIDQLLGDRLPYIDNTVNLVVVEKAGRISADEILRVLAPNGVAYARQGGQWQKIVKPRPKEIDEWTHYMHDPTNNAVAHDSAIDFPKHLQWIGDPKWSRQHDHMSSSNAMVSANGRNFYIADEGSRSSIELPAKWFVIARDAFNGTVLWRRTMVSWHPQLWRLKSGPATMPRRLVAIGDHVFVPLALNAAISRLDAATGEVLGDYPATKGAEEILVDRGVIFAVTNPSPTVFAPAPKDPDDYEFPAGKRVIVAVAVDSGKTLWRQEVPWAMQGSLTADGKRVLWFDGRQVVCVNQQSGEPLWKSEQIGQRKSVPCYYLATLVSYDGTILFTGADPAEKVDYHMDNAETMWAFDAESGKKLWSSPHPQAGYRSPEDLLVVGNLVWTAPLFFKEMSGVFTGRDVKTGEVKVEFPPDVKTHWFHHRCYRAKATDKYLLTSRTGIEFVDPKTQHWTCHHWVRGACLYGIMPANGLINNMPHPCACYLEAKLYGFNALAPASPTREAPREVADEGRLQRGPAFGETSGPAPAAADWPTYRQNSARSGYTKTAVPAEVKQRWESDSLGKRITSPVIALGKVFVASIDEHEVNALDAASGKRLWTFIAGGRIDSPPAVFQNSVIFGSADGFVYCLRASDGVLAWRFRAAPVDRRLVACDQVESVWPVHGNVLLKDGAAWFVAGRSMFLDGGLRLLKLDAATGRKVFEQVFDDRDPDSESNLQVRLKGLNMPVAMPDILSDDGRYVYMRSQRFDDKGQRVALETPNQQISKQQGEGAHLFCPTGFLDDSYWHRSYWVFGERWASGAGGYYLAGRYAPSGRLLVYDEETVYGFSRRREFFRWTTPLERDLFASTRQPQVLKGQFEEPKRAPDDKRPKPTLSGVPDASIEWNWNHAIPLHAMGLVLADKTLFVAGPADTVDEVSAIKSFGDPQTQAKLLAQEKAWQGEDGMVLLAVSAVDGRVLAEHRLASVPVFDGMAAAGGQLYIATKEGKVVCLGK